ncbi:hypothetical protein CAEBREN_19559 [Caenorhabditis brenneri]|uniref:Uncharacterized protein n=1 Tax=Caenorhabditis brenneri TaxID=135651 RepID=G0PN74_CAEBE|nr:hypothetical protein CAEBREN_19559 [Caenorhabditis brenneri]
MYSSSIARTDVQKKRSKSTSNSQLTRSSKKSSIESKFLLPNNLQKKENGNSKSTTGLDMLLNQNNEQKEVPEKRDPYTQEIFDRVFAGKFNNIPKPQSKLVRVFTSSTFTDTTVERNALMEDIYPKLKEYCRETYGLDFQTCDPVVLLRFLGTSPDSSNIAPLLTSVCDQIALNYDESLKNSSPTELSKLFQHFKKITNLASRERPLVIIFDSLDLLSTIDGAHELLWFPPSLPPFVKLFASLTPGGSLIYSKMQRLIEDKRQYQMVPSLGKELGFRVVQEWLSDKGRTLSERQWTTVSKALDKCTLPLFVKLIYATVARWKSYSRPQETILFSSLQESINVLFHRTESQHGKLLVSHALSYISAARSGISDSEVEDLISLDDKVLDDIYQYHLPPVRRIPPLLWSRIRSDLPGYLSERAADGVIVLNWYHQQFRQVAIERYFKNVNHLETCHSAMAEYFLGVWGGVPKPYQYTEMQKQRFGVTENEGLADRKVPKQPNVFSSKDGNHRYNTRKLNELPYHLLRQLTLAVDALRLSASILSRNPSMLAFELLGRLLPLVATNKYV